MKEQVEMFGEAKKERKRRKQTAVQQLVGAFCYEWKVKRGEGKFDYPVRWKRDGALASRMLALYQLPDLLRWMKFYLSARAFDEDQFCVEHGRDFPSFSTRLPRIVSICPREFKWECKNQPQIPQRPADYAERSRAAIEAAKKGMKTRV